MYSTFHAVIGKFLQNLLR